MHCTWAVKTWLNPWNRTLVLHENAYNCHINQLMFIRIDAITIIIISIYLICRMWWRECWMCAHDMSPVQMACRKCISNAIANSISFYILFNVRLSRFTIIRIELNVCLNLIVSRHALKWTFYCKIDLQLNMHESWSATCA